MLARCWVGAAVWLLVSACYAGSPTNAFDQYRHAIARGDADDVAAQHSRRQIALRDPERIQEWRGAHPEMWAAAVDRLAGEVAEVRQLAEVRLTSGATVTLVLEGDQWRVYDGSLWLLAADTPESALQTLAHGLEFDDLGAVRMVIPEAQQSAYASDSTLRAHLSVVRGRVRRALDRIGPLRPGLAEVSGDRATIAYLGERRVRFVWESKRWRVLDVE